MIKYAVLIIVAISAGLFIRTKSNDVAKAMYNEGCSDVVLKLRTIGRFEDAEHMSRFCAARKTSLDQYFGVFE